MTIREQIQTTLRALAEIPAVVEMAREAVEFRKERHVETQLRLRFARQKEHIAQLQARARDNNEVLTKAFREREEWQQRAKRADTRVGEVSDRNNDLQNELGPAKALIDVQRHQLESCSARIRELETKAERNRSELDGLALDKSRLMSQVSGYISKPAPTIADMWQPFSQKEWAATSRSTRVALFDGSRIYAGNRCDFADTLADVTHYIVLEPPR